MGRLGILLLLFDTGQAKKSHLSFCKEDELINIETLTCDPCPEGFTCEKGRKFKMRSPRPGADWDVNHFNFCPAGYECVGDWMKNCEPGFYSSHNLGHCMICPVKHFCPRPHEIFKCPDDAMAMHGVQECEYPPGHKNHRSRRAVENCSPDKYINQSGTCVACKAGHKCDGKIFTRCDKTEFAPAGSGACTACGSNQVPTSDQGGCTACAAGLYPSSDQSFCQPCPPGYSCKNGVLKLCPIGQLVSGDECVDCPAGRECPHPSISQACVDGTFSNGGQAFCQPCPAGFSCSKTGISAECSAGTYSSVGDHVCNICAAGYYCPDTTEASQIKCPDGYYSSGNQAACTICPAGSSCVNQTSAIPCAQGTYSQAGELHCTQCEAGLTCDDQGNPKYCTAGNYSKDGICTPCETNHYCPGNTVIELVCPLGMIPGPTRSDCVFCQAGQYCASEVATGQNCIAGHYCPEGSYVPTPCPAGMFSSTEGLTSRKQCTAAGPGTCTEKEGSTTAEQCPAGYICPDEENSSCRDHPCPPGTKRDGTGGSDESADCEKCAAGKWCPAGSTSERDCPHGFFCMEGEKIGFREKCAAGTYAEGNNMNPSQNPSLCLECPTGYYCPAGSENYPGTRVIPCPAGTYSLSIPATHSNSTEGHCTPCEPGRFCNKPALVVESADKLEKCPEGYYCPSGTVSENQYPCPAGTQQFSVGMQKIEDCAECAETFYCPTATGFANPTDKTNKLGAVRMECNPGYYCPAGSTHGSLFPCPAGTYSTSTNLKEAADCITCPAGYYCLFGSSVPTGPCPPGHFCGPGTESKNQNPCDAGTYQPHFLQTDVSACKTCEKGNFCEEGVAQPVPCPFGTYWNDTIGNEAKNNCIECPAGQFCGAGTVDPSDCPQGFYSKEGWSSCEICWEGYYCIDEGTSFNQMMDQFCVDGKICEEGTIDPDAVFECERGFVCPDGIEVPIACPPGTIQPDKGKNILRDATEQSDCKACPAGYFCQEASWYYNTNFLCDKGFYCPDDIPNPYKTSATGVDNMIYGPNEIGSYGPQQVPCEAGTYLDERGGKSQGDCKECQEGYYCPQGSPEMVACPLGFYCGPKAKQPTPCPVGTFGEKLYLTVKEECTDCTKGYFCDSVGLLQPRGPCDPGYVCPGTNGGAKESNPTDGLTGYVCPEGGYCPAGTYEPWGCPPGTFSSSTEQVDASDCEVCTPGFFCSEPGKPDVTGECIEGCYCEGATPESPDRGAYHECQDPCPQGHYCPRASPLPIQCPRGTYQPQDRKEFCLPCPPGFQCPSLGMLEPILCDAGYHCFISENVGEVSTKDTSIGTISQIEPEYHCGIGNYLSQPGAPTADMCVACPRGHYCDEVALAVVDSSLRSCAGGFVCESGANVPNPGADENSSVADTTGQKCTVGHYCPPGATQLYECEFGTYNPTTGLDDKSKCLECSAGSFCSGFGKEAVTATCADGFFCTSGAMREAPFPTDFTHDTNSAGDECAIGSFCTDGRSETCNLAFFNDEIGRSECLLCPNGFECPSSSETSATPCDEGHVCLGPPSVDNPTASKIPCITGTYGANGTEGFSEMSQCSVCEPGVACSSGKSDIEKGYFSRSASTSTRPIDTRSCDPLSDDLRIGEPIYQDRCGQCPPGYFCYGNATDPNPEPCQPGTYNDNKRGEDSDACGICPEGLYCPLLATTLSDAKSCSDGYHCKSSDNTTGIDSPVPIGKQCEPGSYCKSGLTQECSEGTFTAIDGTIECSRTVAGYFQNSTGEITSIPCTAGNYCAVAELTEPNGECQPGTYFGGIMLSDENCVPCEPGYYCPDSGMTTTKDNICPGTSFCPLGSFDPETCTEGNYCPEGSQTELQCPPGKWCDTAVDIYEDCSAGALCRVGSETDQGIPCPRGSYCETGTPIATECPAGYWRSEEGGQSVNDCSPCPDTKFCPADKVITDNSGSGEQCSNGYICEEASYTDKLEYCPAGSACSDGSEDICQEGTYQNEEGKSSCITCPERYYCDLNTSEPTECDAGNFCATGSTIFTQVPCPAGTYGPAANGPFASDSECVLCPAGYACQNPGQTTDAGKVDCNEGFFCPEGQSSPNKPEFECPKGYYCPAKSAFPIACEPGTFNPLVQQKDQTSCQKCTAGYACPGYGNTAADKPCEAGYYCPADSNSTRQEDCPKGYYCLELQSEGDINPCPAGTWSDRVRLSSRDECQICPAGKICDAPLPNDDYDILLDCPKGSYCVAGDVISCPEGHQCPSAGMSMPIPCPEGTYQPDFGQEACLACSAGEDCPFSELGRTQPDQCRDGWFCAAQTLGSPYIHPVPCSPGSYHETSSPLTSNTCTQCEAGKYCKTIGLSGSSRCEAGYNCNPGSDHAAPDSGCPVGEGDICQKGHSCSSGQPEQECKNGTISPFTGTSTCFSCPKGFSCEDHINLAECDDNSYCERGRAAKQCSAGEFNDNNRGTSRNACEKCLPGHYCPGGDTGFMPIPCTAGTSCFRADAEVSCQSGEYCPAESTLPLLCPPGKECTDPAAPVDCAAGQYCAPTSTESDCPQGHFCNTDQVYPQPCEMGTYNDQFSQSDATAACKNCGNGRYCPGVGTTQSSSSICDDGYFCPDSQPNFVATSVICPAGSFCSNTGEAELCETKTYSPVEGSSECIDCPDGFLCDDSPATIVPTPCPEGSFCKDGEKDQCGGSSTVGYYRDKKYGVSEEDCFTCPEGQFCDASGILDSANTCSPGYFCTQLSDAQEPTGRYPEDAAICPPGYFCNDGKQRRPCPPGQYLPTQGATDEGDCIDCEGDCPYEAMTIDSQCPAGFHCDPVTIRCPAGYFCAPGAGKAHCPAGTWTDRIGLKSADECYDCPEGYYCPARTDPDDEPSALSDFSRIEANKCQDGYYCPRGSSSATEFSCPAGFKCPAGSSIYLECEPIHYADANQSECKKCEAGSTCFYADPDANGQRKSIKETCPYGMYCPGWSSISDPPGGQNFCPVGKYGPSQGASLPGDCQDCPEGSYCNVPGQDADNLPNCGRGSNCPEGSDVEASETCPPGSACNNGITYECPVNQFSIGDGSSQCSPCNSGYECLGGVDVQDCPAGQYCTSAGPLNCPAGTYNSYETAGSLEDCVPCPAGFVCPEEGAFDTSLASPCGAGSYCPGGNTDISQESCSVGTFCPAGSGFPTACPPGYDCDGTNATPCAAGDVCKIGSEILPCPEGHYCKPTESKHPISCDRGTSNFGISGTDENACTSCTNEVCDAVGLGGTLNDINTPCLGGYFCDTAADRPDFKQCPEGSMCPSDSSAAEICSEGTFQASAGKMECDVCLDGFLCKTDFIDPFTDPCPEGSYCIQAKQTLCPKGTWLGLKAQVSDSSCDLCPDGKACSVRGISDFAFMDDCTSGYSCISGATKINPSTTRSLIGDILLTGRCEPGMFCDNRDPAVTYPIQCPLGTYRDRRGAMAEDECYPCSAGHFCGETGITLKPDATTECAAKFNCDIITPALGASSYAYGAMDQFGSSADPAGSTPLLPLTQNPCEAGHYCQEGSSSASKSPCKKGSYSGGQYNDDPTCTDCTPGFYCDEDGLTVFTEVCEKGFYCPAGSKSTRQKCGRTMQCPEGSADEQHCTPGNYNNEAGKDTCKLCPDGKFCDPREDSTLPCPKGFTCKMETEGVPLKKCPKGSYKIRDGNSECLDCPLGKYCDGAEPWDTTGDCAGGFVCTSGGFAEYPFDVDPYFDVSDPCLPNSTSSECEAGHYCDGARQTPCDPGTYMPHPKAEKCYDCPPGYACDTAGITDIEEKACRPGYVCTGLIEIPCEPGTYNPRTYGISKEKDCLACPRGFVCAESGLDSVDESRLCPAGHYCPKGSAVALVCPQGFYCPGYPELGMEQAGASPIRCPAGYDCSDGALETYLGQECQQGLFCPTGMRVSSAAIDCPIGSYCPEATSHPLLCPPGTYGGQAGLPDEDACDPCDAGSFCAGYGNTPDTLEPCLAGYYCPAGSDRGNQLICPEGFMCQEGSEMPIACNVESGDSDGGVYQDQRGQGECKKCPAGFYCYVPNNSAGETGVVVPALCPAGFYCPAETGDFSETMCEPGTYNGVLGATNEDECTPCWGGFYCPEEGHVTGDGKIEAPDGTVSDPNLCAAGYYCPAGSISEFEEECPGGAYCEAGSSGYRPCPRGTSRSSKAGAISVDECKPCPTGYYCRFGASGDVESITETRCEKGFVCVKGAYLPAPNDESGNNPFNSTFDCDDVTSSQGCIDKAYDLGLTGFPCPKGFRCHQKSAAYQLDICGVGFYQDQYGQSDCKPCPRGYYCPKPGTHEPKICDAGSYCPQRSEKPKECAAGYYSNVTGLYESSQCKECPAGHYCTGGTNIKTCKAGYFCKRRAPTDKNGGFDQNGNGPCPSGFYCEAATVLPKPCAPGTYGPSVGLESADQCGFCPAGNYCPYKAMNSIEFPLVRHQCKDGFSCDPNNNASITVPDPMDFICRPGSKCEAGRLQECRLSTYQSAAGQGDCLSNPPGWMADTDGTAFPEQCPFGKFCARQSASAYCPLGSYNDVSNNMGRSTDCKPCPAGKHCSNGEIKGDCNAGAMCYGWASVPEKDTQLCPNGYYCTAGTNETEICDDGKFITGLGEENDANCKPCEDGKYCPEGAKTVSDCGKGGWCTGGQFFPCPIGTFNNKEEQTDPDACLDCPVGHICPYEGMSEPDRFPAQAGFYINITGADDMEFQEPCPPGFFLAKTKSSDKSECTSCPPGYFCPDPAMDYQFGCPEGSYCVESETIAADNSTEPALCPEGYFCDRTNKIEKCPAGYYCPEGSAFPTTCPPGTYCPESGKCGNDIFTGEDLGISANNTSPCRCSSGYFELEESKRESEEDTCQTCPPGYYRELDTRVTDSCIPCRSGVLCFSPAITDLWNVTISNNTNTIKCPDGYYCAEAALEPLPCPQGTFFDLNKTHELGLELEEVCEACPVNTFSNYERAFECTACGDLAEQKVEGSNKCQCYGKNRVFQPSTRDCPCRTGYKSSEQDDDEGDCRRVIYDICASDQFRKSNGECQTLAELENECMTSGCPKDTFVGVNTQLGICECKVSPLDETCDINCRRDNEEVFKFKCPDPLDGVEPLFIIGGIETAISGENLESVVCENREESEQSIFIVSTDDEQFLGLYNPDPSQLSDVLSSSGRRRRQANNTISRSGLGADVIEQPVVCFELNQVVMFMVDKDNYPVYDDSILFNEGDFDSGAFQELAKNLDGVSQPVPFFYQFRSPGVFSIRLGESDSARHIYVQVMEEEGTCFSNGPFFSASPRALNQANVEQNQQLLLEPDWIFIFSFIGLLLFIILLCLFIYWLTDRYGWFQTVYTDTWYHRFNLDMNLFGYHSRQTETKMEQKVHPLSKTDNKEDDLPEDDLFDYKEQKKVEDFRADNVFSLIDTEVNRAKIELDDQAANADLAYAQTEAETESLKRIWKNRLNKMKNNDNRGISQDDLDEFSRSESEIMREVARRKAIGEVNAKNLKALSNAERKKLKADAEFDANFMALATELMASTTESRKDEISSKMQGQIDAQKRDLLTSDFKLLKLGQKEETYTRDELFSSEGKLLRSDLIAQNPTTGILTPIAGSSARCLKTNEIISLTENHCISPASGRVYPIQGNVLLDPGRLRLLVFDEISADVSSCLLIPFDPADKASQTVKLQSPANFRLWKSAIEGTTGLTVPIMAAKIVDKSCVPVGKSTISAVTGLLVPQEPYGISDHQDDERKLYLFDTKDHNDFIAERKVHFFELLLNELEEEDPNLGVIRGLIEQINLSVQSQMEYAQTKLALLDSQYRNFTNLGRFGGVIGYMEFKDTGKLLPVIHGWKVDDCPILNIHYDYENEKDIPLYLSKSGEPVTIGTETKNKSGQTGFVTSLKWSNKLKLVEEVIQVGPFLPRHTPNYVNAFELEYGARMNFIKKVKQIADKTAVDLADKNTPIRNDLVNLRLEKDDIKYYSVQIRETAKDLRRLLEIEEKRRKNKIMQLENAVSSNVVSVLTDSDVIEKKIVEDATSALDRLERKLFVYIEKVEDEEQNYQDRLADIVGTEDMNQLAMLERRHELAQARVFSEFVEQIDIKLHYVLLQLNLLGYIEDMAKVNANIAKDLVRGTIYESCSVINADMNIRLRKKRDDRGEKFLEKLKEMVTILEPNSKYGLFHTDKIAVEGGGKKLEASSSSDDVFQMVEKNKYALKHMLDAEYGHRLDEAYEMYDKRASAELEQLRKEVLSTIPPDQDARKESFRRFNDQAKKIVDENERAKAIAAARIVDEAKRDGKLKVKKFENDHRSDLDKAGLSNLLTEQEVDDYVDEMAARHKAIHEMSRDKIEHLSKIDDSAWEDIFRREVAPFFKQAGLKEDDLDDMFSDLMASANLEAAQIELATDSIDIHQSEITDLAQNIAEIEMFKQMQQSVENNDDLSRAEKDKLLRELAEARQRARESADAARQRQKDRLRDRLAQRRGLVERGMSISEADKILDDIHESTDTAEDADLETLPDNEELKDNMLKSAEEEARKQALEENLDPSDAEKLMQEHLRKAQDQYDSEELKKQQERDALRQRMKDLAALKAAKRAAEAAAKRKREEDIARENSEFAKIADEATDPAEIYRIMAKRHAREMEDLERAFFRDQEMAKLEKQNKIREERMKLREKITNPEELAKFDAETERLLSEAAKITPEDQLELIRRKNELKERQMKEVQDALEKLSPEYAMKLDAERQAQKKAEMEKASREEAAKAMALEIERQKKEKLRKLEQLEAEQRRKDEEMAAKAKSEAEAERAKLEKRKAMEEKRLEQKANSKIREASSDEDVDQLMADLNAQKDILNAKYADRHAAHRRQIEERLRARQARNAEKAQLEAELSDLNQLDFSLPSEQELREQVLQLDVSEYAANALAILKELPVMKSIQEFEKRIAEQMTLDANKPVKGAVEMPFIDVFDVENPTDGELSVVENCPDELKPNFEMATRLMDELCSRVNAQIPTLLIADALPHTSYSHNVFRNSYFFDARANLGYIHISRMREPGQLALIIAHFAAHLKVNEFTNDSDLGFLSAFFETIRILLHLSAKSTSVNHSRAAADHDLLEARVYGPALGYQPIKDGIVNLRYERKRELAVAEQPSRTIMETTSTSKSVKARHRDHLTELEGESNLELEQLRKAKTLASKAGEKALADELEILIQEKRKMIEGIQEKS